MSWRYIIFWEPYFHKQIIVLYSDIYGVFFCLIFPLCSKLLVIGMCRQCPPLCSWKEGRSLTKLSGQRRRSCSRPLPNTWLQQLQLLLLSNFNVLVWEKGSGHYIKLSLTLYCSVLLLDVCCKFRLSKRFKLFSTVALWFDLMYFLFCFSYQCGFYCWERWISLVKKLHNSWSFVIFFFCFLMVKVKSFFFFHHDHKLKEQKYTRESIPIVLEKLHRRWSALKRGGKGSRNRKRPY